MADPVLPDHRGELAAVHRVFRTSLAAAPGFVGSGGDAERRELVASYYANLLAFLDVHHQGEELLLFAPLAQRAPEAKALLETAEAQHAEVEGKLHDAAAAVAAWDATGAGAAEVVRALEALDAVLTPHLDQEEIDIPPLAAAHMTAEEWGMLPGHGMAHFTGDKIWLILGLIREQMSPEQLAMMEANMPPPALEMWRTMGEAAFTEMVGTIRVGS